MPQGHCQLAPGMFGVRRLIARPIATILRQFSRVLFVGRYFTDRSPVDRVVRILVNTMGHTLDSLYRRERKKSALRVSSNTTAGEQRPIKGRTALPVSPFLIVSECW